MIDRHNDNLLTFPECSMISEVVGVSAALQLITISPFFEFVALRLASDDSWLACSINGDLYWSGNPNLKSLSELKLLRGLGLTGKKMLTPLGTNCSLYSDIFSKKYGTINVVVMKVIRPDGHVIGDLFAGTTNDCVLPIFPVEIQQLEFLVKMLSCLVVSLPA